MRQIAVFAKHWTPGLAKTRLAAEIGPERAAAIYRACLETTLRRFDACGDRRDLVFTPREEAPAFGALAGACWRVLPQETGNLGARLAAYVRRARTSGARAVVFLGGDSPTIPLDLIEMVWRLLKDQPVVISPAADGGYCLLGVSQFNLPIFSGIAWGTDQVLRQTTDRLRIARIDYSLVSPWYDVDDGAGLARLRDELQRLPMGESVWDSLRAAVERPASE